MIELDHLAVACTDLAQGADWVAAKLGVPLQKGGTHVRYGTHNMLLGLADGLYLEVIAKDPETAPEAGHSWFGMDHFQGAPRLANWICRADNLSTYTDITGPVQALTRADLRWDITVPDDGSLPYGGAFPTLMKWAPDTVHPAQRLTPTGLRLVQLTVSHPDAAYVAAQLALSDPRIRFETGPAGFHASFDGPDGPKDLS